MVIVDTVYCNIKSPFFPTQLSAETAVRVCSGEGTDVAANCSHWSVTNSDAGRAKFRL